MPGKTLYEKETFGLPIYEVNWPRVEDPLLDVVQH